MMRVALFIFSLFILCGCRQEEEAVAPAQVEEVPEFSSTQEEKIRDYLESAAKVEAAVGTGVNIVRFSELVSDLTGEFLIVKEIWPEGVAEDQREALVTQLEGYHLALRLWQVRVEERDEYAYIADYVDDLDRRIHKDRVALFNDFRISDYYVGMNIEKVEDRSGDPSKAERRIYVKSNVNWLLGEASSHGENARKNLLNRLKNNG